MTITALVDMAKRIHDAEGYKLGSASTREYRNAYWARVIGCAYHGHPVYNANPDKQWHLKKGDPGRPQTDDVATSMPSRNYWDCINGVGADGYTFGVSAHSTPLSPEQIVYAPPIPAGTAPTPGPTPVPPPAPTYPSYEALGGDEGGKKITRQLEADYQRAGKPGLDGDCGAWQQRVSYDFLTGVCRTVEESVAKHRPGWCAALGIPVV